MNKINEYDYFEDIETIDDFFNDVKGEWYGNSFDGKNSIHRFFKNHFGDDCICSFQLQNRGYDGIIINNAKVGFGENIRHIKEEIIVLEPNQIKSIDNKYPSKSSDNIFEKERNEKGSKRMITQEMYFKDSAIRNNDGSLKVCYHATNEKFEAFSKDFIGNCHGNSYGDGFYFSSEPLHDYGPSLECYLNIKNPYVIEKVNSLEDITKFLANYLPDRLYKDVNQLFEGDKIQNAVKELVLKSITECMKATWYTEDKKQEEIKDILNKMPELKEDKEFMKKVIKIAPFLKQKSLTIDERLNEAINIRESKKSSVKSTKKQDLEI